MRLVVMLSKICEKFKSFMKKIACCNSECEFSNCCNIDEKK